MKCAVAAVLRELPRANMTKYMKVLQLKKYNWVDQQTRALLMTFNVYIQIQTFTLEFYC